MLDYSKRLQAILTGISFVLLYLFASNAIAHGGEPDHGGDLPMVIGFNPKQYEGQYKLYDIKINSGSFEPTVLTIDAGSRVVFENQDNIEHRVIFDRGSEIHDHPVAGDDHDHPAGEGHQVSHIIRPGGYWILHFIVPGDYPYTSGSIEGVTGYISVRY